jgi:hypothetical protein
VIKVEVPAVLVQSKFEFKVPENVAQLLVTATSQVEPVAKLLNQNGLPTWLSFDPKTLTFSATDAPPGSLPVKIEIQSGNVKIIVEIDDLRN